MACLSTVDRTRRRTALRIAQARTFTAALALFCCDAAILRADSAQTANFRVVAENADIAEQLALHAEEIRSALAQDWLGSDLPDWEQPCVVQVTLCSRLSGDTTYTLGQSDVAHWRMLLRGPFERIIETLLPHEVLHTVLASHYRQSVPRWADEGAAMSVESDAEQERLWALEGSQLLNGRRLSLAELFAREEYPEDHDELRAFYVQGAAVTRFLLHAGKTRFLAFVELGITDGWEQAAAVQYGFADLESLESAWLSWLRHARPVIAVPEGQSLSEATRTTADAAIVATSRVSAATANESPGGL